MRIVYAGTPEFAVPALDAIQASAHELVAVYTQPDRVAGRGRELRASPVKERALALGLPVVQPAGLRTPEAAATLARWRCDVLVVAAYGLLLPVEILTTPPLGCVNIHASLLPRWRGAAPIQRAIEAGDSQTGVSIMQMEKGLDTGPVYAVRSTPIDATDNAGMLTARLAQIGAQLLLEVLDAIAAGTARAVAQPALGVTYARKLEKGEALLDFALPAADLARRVRAYNPWPVAETRLAGQTLRLWEAAAVDGPGAAPGEVVALSPTGIVVATGSGCLRITRLQAAGRKPVTAAEFLNGRTGLAVGTALGQ